MVSFNDQNTVRQNLCKYRYALTAVLTASQIPRWKKNVTLIMEDWLDISATGRQSMIQRRHDDHPFIHFLYCLSIAGADAS